MKLRIVNAKQCTFDFVLEYRNWLLDDQKKAKSTVNNRIAAIKSYMYYAAAKDIGLQQIQINISAVPFLKVEKIIRPIIENTDTLKALLNAPPNTKIGCRDVMILSVLFNTMIRADELMKLNIQDVVIDSDIPFLKIHGKGGKERMAPLSVEAIQIIKAYLKQIVIKEGDKTAISRHPMLFFLLLNFYQVINGQFRIHRVKHHIISLHGFHICLPIDFGT